MKTTLSLIIKNDEVAGLDCCEVDAFIRLQCGSTISLDTKILKRLFAILEKEKELALDKTNS
jgi:hypothetical protein